MVAGVSAQGGECLLGVEPEPFGERPLRLLDDDPAGQRGPQVPDEFGTVVRGPLLQQPDGGDVGERSGDSRDGTPWSRALWTGGW